MPREDETTSEPLSIRGALEAASESLSTTEAPAAGEATSTATAAPETVETSTAAPEPTGERVRDGQGRFAPKTSVAPAPSPATPATENKAAAAGVEPVAPVAAPVPEAKYKAPQSWKPLAREKFSALPPEVQEEIHRRESEMPVALQEAAEAKRFQAQVSEVFRPYEMLARASGQHPVQYAAGLMQTAAALQTGAPTQRAAVVANIIKTFGVDVEALAAALDGQGPAPQQAQQADPRAIFREELQRVTAEATNRRATGEVEKFAAAHEFANDPGIRRRMAAIIQAEAEAGIEMSLNDAYDQVVMSHPEYRAVVEQRKAADAAKATVASAQRAKAAASSIRSNPAAAPSGSAQPKTIREALEAASERISGRV